MPRPLLLGHQTKPFEHDGFLSGSVVWIIFDVAALLGRVPVGVVAGDAGFGPGVLLLLLGAD
jgi:hypothetical protein